MAKENQVTVMDHHEGKRTEQFVDDPMSLPKKIIEEWKPQQIDELPDAFCGERNLDVLLPLVSFVHIILIIYLILPHYDGIIACHSFLLYVVKREHTCNRGIY